MRHFRTIWKFLVPGWLQRGDGELIQLVEGTALDAFAEACHQTNYLMLPELAPSDALDKIGADRGLPRGRIEPEDAYRERLRRWRWPQGHRVRGNAPGLLEQIALSIDATEHQTVDARGTRYTHGVAVPERGVSWDWDGEALLPNWGRFWVVVNSPGAIWPSFDDGAWGETIDAPQDYCLAGSGVDSGAVDAVKRLVRVGRLSWTPAGRRPVYLVIWFEGDGETYPEPDGTWDEWENRPRQSYAFEPLHESVT